MPEPILALEEAAARLCCSIRRVERLIEEGRLRIAVGQNGREGVSEASFRAWKSERTEALAWFEAWSKRIAGREAPPE